MSARLSIVLCISWFVSAINANGQPKPATEAELWRQALGVPTIAGRAVQAVRQGVAAVELTRRTRRAIRDHVIATKERFWSAYPDGPDFEQARADFAAALDRRDTFELAMSRLGPQIVAMAGGDPEGSIPEGARPSFAMWEEAWRGQLSGRETEEQAKKREFLYQRYLVARDLEEFRTAHKTPVGLESTWPIMVAAVEAATSDSTRLGPKGYEKAQNEGLRVYPTAMYHPYLEVLEMTQVFGAQRLAELYSRLKEAGGPWEVPMENAGAVHTVDGRRVLGRDTMLIRALISALAAGSEREFVIKSIRDTFSGSDEEFGWKSAAADYDALVKEKGESDVTAAVRVVREARVEQTKHSLLGERDYNPWGKLGCLQPRSASPRGGVLGCVRLILGMSEFAPVPGARDYTTSTPTPSAYQRFPQSGSAWGFWVASDFNSRAWCGPKVEVTVIGPDKVIDDDFKVLYRALRSVESLISRVYCKRKATVEDTVFSVYSNNKLLQRFSVKPGGSPTALAPDGVLDVEGEAIVPR